MPVHPLKLIRCRDGATASVVVVPMSPKKAGAMIDSRWWVSRSLRESIPQPDRSWRWAKLMTDESQTPGMECWAVCLPKGDIAEGAMMLSEALSIRRPGEPALYIEYLATAPRNRDGLSPTPRFKGVGCLLLRHAVDRSIETGCGGSLLLSALPSAYDWYIRRGFEDTSEVDSEGYPLLELPEGALQCP